MATRAFGSTAAPLKGGTAVRRGSAQRRASDPNNAAVAPASAKPAEGWDTWQLAAKRCLLLRALPKEIQGYLFRSLKTQKTAAGEIVYAEGALPADGSVYIVRSGRYRATRGPRTVREYGEAEMFGSHELILGVPRSTTVTSLEAGSLLVLSKKAFDAKAKVAPAPPPSIVERIKKVETFAGLSEEMLRQCCRAVAETTVQKGDAIFRQGEAATTFYFLEEGQLKSVVDANDAEKRILKAPHSFGESALVSSEEYQKRGSDVVAWAGPATLLSFATADVEALVGYGLQQKMERAYNHELLGSVCVGGKAIMEGGVLDEAATSWLCDALVEEPPQSDGQVVVRAGDTDDKLYMITHGQATVTLGDAGGEAVATLGRGQFFGELALTRRAHKRSATVAARSGSEPLRLLSLSGADVARQATTMEALGRWIGQLDAQAEADAQKAVEATAIRSAYGQGTKAPSTTAAGTSKVTRFNERRGSPAGLAAAKEGKGAQPPALLKRRSFGERMVEAQAAAKQAAEKAARVANRYGGGGEKKAEKKAVKKAVATKKAKGAPMRAPASALEEEAAPAAAAPPSPAVPPAPPPSRHPSGEENGRSGSRPRMPRLVRGLSSTGRGLAGALSRLSQRISRSSSRGRGMDSAARSARDSWENAESVRGSAGGASARESRESLDGKEAVDGGVPTRWSSVARTAATGSGRMSMTVDPQQQALEEVELEVRTA